MSARDFLARFWRGDALVPEPVREAAPPPPAPVDPAAVHVREVGAFDPDAKQFAEGGFRQLTSGQTSWMAPYYRDLSPLKQDYQNRIVAQLWQRNLLARWLIEVVVDFTLGEEAKVTSPIPEIQAVIDAFWSDPVNDLDTRLDGFIREYGLYGELILTAAVNEIDGHVRLGYLDPLDVDSIVADPRNVLVLTDVVMKADRSGGPNRVYKVIREDQARYSRTYGYLMPARLDELCLYNGRPYDGSCFLFQTNKLSNGRRGRSDLLPAIDWVDQYDNFLFDSMDLANLLNTFVWDAKLEGFNEERIKEWLGKFGANIKRGEIFAHNEKVTLTPQTPNLQAPDKDAFARLHRGYILGGFGYPEHWFGLGGSVNFATAKEMATPPMKRLARRQKEVRHILDTLVRFAIDQAVVHGELPPVVHLAPPPDVDLPSLEPAPEPTATVNESRLMNGHAPIKHGDVSPVAYLMRRKLPVRESASKDALKASFETEKPTAKAYDVMLPELSARDQASTVAALVSLTSSLIQAQEQGWLRPETAATLFANMISLLGQDVNPKEEFTPGGPLRDYADPDMAQQLATRIAAQLGRQGEGNGDNVNERKHTTAKGGQTDDAGKQRPPRVREAWGGEPVDVLEAAFDERLHPRRGKGDPRGGQFAPAPTSGGGLVAKSATATVDVDPARLPTTTPARIEDMSDQQLKAEQATYELHVAGLERQRQYAEAHGEEDAAAVFSDRLFDYRNQHMYRQHKIRNELTRRRRMQRAEKQAARRATVAVDTQDGPIMVAVDAGPHQLDIVQQLTAANAPAAHFDGLSAIKFAPQMGAATSGTYRPSDRSIKIGTNPRGRGLAITKGTVLHELGHHVHLAKLTDPVAEEWARISIRGKLARISAYARTNQGEHFAEAYRAYAQGGVERDKLLSLEPRAHAFMAGLWENAASKTLPPGTMTEGRATFQARYRGK